VNKELEKAINLSGNHTTLARELGLTRQCISRWVRYGVPLDKGILLERHFKGKVKMVKLCAEKLEDI